MYSCIRKWEITNNIVHLRRKDNNNNHNGNNDNKIEIRLERSNKFLVNCFWKKKEEEGKRKREPTRKRKGRSYLCS